MSVDWVSCLVARAEFVVVVEGACAKVDEEEEEEEGT